MEIHRNPKEVPLAKWTQILGTQIKSHGVPLAKLTQMLTK
jgi:hypothetical protein